MEKLGDVYVSMSNRRTPTLPRILPSFLRLLMMSSSVVLPAPLGPMTAHMSPEKIVPVTCACARERGHGRVA